MSTTATTDDVLQALARFRAADIAMHERVRVLTSLGDNELRILRFLLDRRDTGHVVKPSEISRHLGISSASTTALLDRLERQGKVERVSHPTDRRSILIAPTDRAAEEVAAHLDAFDSSVASAIERLEPHDRGAVRQFLDAVAAAAGDIAPASERRSSYASI